MTIPAAMGVTLAILLVYMTLVWLLSKWPVTLTLPSSSGIRPTRDGCSARFPRKRL